MKRSLIAVAVALTLGVGLYAKDVKITACTADHKIAELGVTLDDRTPDSIAAEVRTAFVNAAKGLTAEAFVSREGFIAFVAGLSDEDKDSIVGIDGPPVIVAGSCK